MHPRRCITTASCPSVASSPGTVDRALIGLTQADFTGRLEGGVTTLLPGGLSGRGAVAYDGIGTDYDAWTGKVWVNVPLH